MPPVDPALFATSTGVGVAGAMGWPEVTVDGPSAGPNFFGGGLGGWAVEPLLPDEAFDELAFARDPWPDVLPALPAAPAPTGSFGCACEPVVEGPELALVFEVPDWLAP